METKSQVKEEWRPVVGYEGRYEVSDQGRVRSIRTRKRKDGTKVTVRYVLKPHIHCIIKNYTRKKYPYYAKVFLYKDGKHNPFSIHVLVAQAFIGPRPEGMTVDHINEDKFDNRRANLQYISRKENVLKSRRLGRICSNKYRYTIFTEGLYAFFYQTYSIQDVAERIGVPKNTIKAALRRKGVFKRNGIKVVRDEKGKTHPQKQTHPQTPPVREGGRADAKESNLILH